MDETALRVVPFYDETLSTTEKGTLVVHISAKVQEERALLAEYVRQLHFPSYFGWNWDAFHDCLSDLSWLDDDIQRVIIVHQDIPFPNDFDQRATYLSILRSERFLPDSDGSFVQVVFPRAVHGSLQE